MVTQSRSGVSQPRSGARALLSGKGGKADYRLEPKRSDQERKLSTAGEFQSRRAIASCRLFSRFRHTLRHQLGFDCLWTARHPGHERSVQHLHQRGERFFETLKSKLLQSLERWDAVVFAQGWFVGLSLGDVQRNDLWVFLRLNSIETVDGVFHRFGQIIKRMNIFAVHFRDRQVSEIFVADSSIHGKNLTKDNNTTVAFRK